MRRLLPGPDCLRKTGLRLLILPLGCSYSPTKLGFSGVPYASCVELFGFAVRGTYFRMCVEFDARLLFFGFGGVMSDGLALLPHKERGLC